MLSDYNLFLNRIRYGIFTFSIEYCFLFKQANMQLFVYVIKLRANTLVGLDDDDDPKLKGLDGCWKMISSSPNVTSSNSLSLQGKS